MKLCKLEKVVAGIEVLQVYLWRWRINLGRVVCVDGDVYVCVGGGVLWTVGRFLCYSGRGAIYEHIWELPGNSCVFTMVILFYMYH